ncbi:MAG: hypothetical protein HY779_03475 [Rubrobacteridae bacterium]|nr:hypothetical protein [Rubrobacteridae bacterium]
MCFGDWHELGGGYCGHAPGKKQMESVPMETGHSPHMSMMGMGHHMGHPSGCPWCNGSGSMMHGRHHKGPIMLAKHAKKELLYEKVKSKIDRRYGDKLDRVADEIVELATQKTQMKLEFMKKKMEMKTRVWEMMSELLEEGPAEENPQEMQQPQEEWHEG